MTASAPAAPPFPPLKNDLLLRAARGEETERAPVWVMRQAGRYLPEFRAVREKHDFFTVCRTPELATEVTLQPIRRYSGLLDAAIIFSDILVIPQALGVEVLMNPGPSFPSPLQTPEDVEALLARPLEVRKELAYVYEAIGLTRRRLEGEVPLIGFVGAPWTLFAYMFSPASGGSESKTSFPTAKRFLHLHPDLSHRLLARLAEACTEHLVGQAAAGAQMLQVFDSWAGELSPSDFSAFALPYLASIVKETKARLGHGAVPITCFAKGVHSPSSLRSLAMTGYNTLGLDWALRPAEVRSWLGQEARICLQGNLDPAVLFTSPEVIKEQVRKMFSVEEGGFGKGQGGGHIANLGHGIQPGVDPEMMRCFLQAVHDEGRKARQE